MRSLAVVLAGSLLATGCLSHSYRVSGDELARLAALPPLERNQHVRVAQEYGATDVEPATAVDDSTQVSFGGGVDINVGGGGGGRGYVHAPPGAHPMGGGGAGHVGGGGLHLSGGGGDGKGVAIAILVIAVVAVVAVAAIETARFDGFVLLHPMHPVHLFGHDGGYAVVPLAAIDPGMAAWADHAIIRSAEGPWHELERGPLSREGFTYSVYFGGASLRSEDGSIGVGTAGTFQLGYFITPQVGLVGSTFFAWRNNLEGATVFDSRYTLELQAMPVMAGRFHAGFYAGAGGATRLEDGVPNGDASSIALTGGAQLQLELDTRLALTARFGLADAHDEQMREIVVGLSVY